MGKVPGTSKPEATPVSTLHAASVIDLIVKWVAQVQKEASGLTFVLPHAQPQFRIRL